MIVFDLTIKYCVLEWLEFRKSRFAIRKGWT
jgi:hypothetical protein